jgi:MSHA biogenesis protein MshQ
VGIKHLFTVIFLQIMTLFTIQAFAFEDINYDKYFPAVIQGHHGTSTTCQNSQLTIYNAVIKGTGGKALSFCSINNANQRGNNCDGNVCTIINTTSGEIDGDGIDLSKSENTFLQSSSNTGITWGTCTSNDQLGDVSSQFGSVILDKTDCELTFKAISSGEYRIKQLILNKNSVVNLPAGDYFIESFDVQGGTPIINTAGNVRIFVKNNINLSGGTSFNPNASGRFTLIGYSNISFNTSLNILNGYLYTQVSGFKPNNKSQIT